MSTISNQSYIRIGKHATPRKPHSLPIIHAFFGAGGFIGFLATTWLGVHLWMMLHGEIAMHSSFALQRSTHAFAQTYLFIGLFVCGFLIQALPKMLRVEARRRSAVIAVLPLHLLTLVALLFDAPAPFVQIPVAAAYLTLLIDLVRHLSAASSYHQLRIGVPIGTGLFTFAVGALYDMGDPRSAWLVLGSGLFPIIVATIQQFIVGFLDGQLPSPRMNRLIVGSLVATVLCIWIGTFTHSLLAERLSGVGIAITAGLLASATGLVKGAYTQWRDSIGLACIASFLWLAVTAAVATINTTDLTVSDSLVHLFGTGVAIPLILATSSRIIGFLSTGEIVKERLLYWAIAIWQVVPFGRARILDLPGWFSWIVGVAALISLGLWLGLLLRRITTVVTRHLRLHAIARSQAMNGLNTLGEES